MQSISEKIKNQAKAYFGDSERGRGNFALLEAGIDGFHLKGNGLGIKPNEDYRDTLQAYLDTIGIAREDSDEFFRDPKVA